ncbi:MAG: hypothetical protein AAF468_07255 [Pseudomonadota bacterium]
MSDPDWEKFCESDESLLWTGKPDQGWYFRRNEWPVLLVALGNAVIGCLAIYAGLEGGAPTWFVIMFGFVTVLGFSLIPWKMHQFRRQRIVSRYALTSKRAMILVLKEPNELWSFPIEETNRLDLLKHDGDLSSLLFKDEALTVGERKIASRHPFEIGFEYIRDGARVQELMRDLSAGENPMVTKRTVPEKFA